MELTQKEFIEKAMNNKDVHYKIFEVYRIFDTLYKDEAQAQQIEDENGWHKDTVKKTFIILTEYEYAQEADFFPSENYISRMDKDFENIKDLYLTDYARICIKCNGLLDNGYLVNEYDWYCTDDCLEKDFTKEQYLEMYEQDEAFWTELN